MEKTRRYEIDGLVVEIPVHYDSRTGLTIEDYPDFIENPLWTESGYRVLFSGTDACPRAEEAEPGGCPDCGSCKYHRRAGEQTWFGICVNQKNKKETKLTEGEV